MYTIIVPSGHITTAAYSLEHKERYEIIILVKRGVH